MAFEVGEMVVYPGRGICEIKVISTQEIDGKAIEFYHMTFLPDEATVMVPVKNASTIGIRRLMAKTDVPKVFAFLEEDIKAPSRDYKVRYQRYVDLLSSGTIFDIARVAKSLYYLSTIKKLSKREDEMLERTRTLLIDEVARVMGAEKSEVQAKVEKFLEQIRIKE